MTTKTESYLDKISDLFHRYIDTYPQELERLTVLSRQLQERDQRLNDRKNMIGHLTASALVINQDNQCLLIHHRFLKRWLQPGGHLDEDEMPEFGALRELTEETGIRAVTAVTALTDLSGLTIATNLGPIDIDSHAIPPSDAKQEGAHLHHDFQYIFRLDQEHHSNFENKIELQAAEVSDHKWASLKELADGSYGQRLARVADKIARAKFNQTQITDPDNQPG